MYSNIVLIISSRNKNFLIVYIESFLLIYMVWCFGEIVIGLSFQSSLGILASDFSLLNIINWVGVDNIPIFFITNVFWFIFTLIIAVYCYRDKKSVYV